MILPGYICCIKRAGSPLHGIVRAGPPLHGTVRAGSPLHGTVRLRAYTGHGVTFNF